MIDIFILGASMAFKRVSLLFVLFGVLWGIVGGALPGITGSIAMALLLPLTFNMDPSVALMMLAGVYIGAMYGSSITAILIRTPGAPASAVTVLDGYEFQGSGQYHSDWVDPRKLESLRTTSLRSAGKPPQSNPLSSVLPT